MLEQKKRQQHHRVPHFGHTRHGHLPVHAATTDYHRTGSLYSRVNKKLAVWITVGVGSMTCAWLFALLAIAGLPTSLKPGNIGLLFWISSDFLQLTLLSVIIVGQNIQAQAADARAAKTFEDTETIADRVNEKTEGGIKAVLDVVDRLDEHTEGGIKTIVDRIDTLGASLGELHAKLDAPTPKGHR